MYDCVERSAIVLFSMDFCVNISFINGLFLYRIEFPRSFSLNLMKIMDLTNVIKFSARNMAVTMVWWLVHLQFSQQGFGSATLLLWSLISK